MIIRIIHIFAVSLLVAVGPVRAQESALVQSNLAEPARDLPARLDSVAKGKIVEMNGSFLTQMQERDSVLIADQLLYGFSLDKVQEGTQFQLPDWSKEFQEGVMVLTPWIVDTVKVHRAKKGQPKLLDIKGSVVITSFVEGEYELPRVAVQRVSKEGVTDTLLFEPQTLKVTTMPVDTATFKVHDIKGQIRYPLTFREILPWLLLFWGVSALIILIVCLVMMYRKKASGEVRRVEPAHIVALRKLDKYRGDKLWMPEKQKSFYSGVTDALREYIVSRYGISAMEMTTKEIFDDLSGTDVPKDLYEELKGLFERADYVKFAKYVASNDENAMAVPLAVRFVTTTYQTELDSEMPAGDSGEVQSGTSDEEVPGNIKK